MLNRYIYSLGQGITAANASTKKPKRGERNAFSVMSAKRTVTELKSISSVMSLTKRLMVALTSFIPSVTNMRKENQLKKINRLIIVSLKLKVVRTGYENFHACQLWNVCI